MDAVERGEQNITLAMVNRVAKTLKISLSELFRNALNTLQISTRRELAKQYVGFKPAEKAVILHASVLSCKVLIDWV